MVGDDPLAAFLAWVRPDWHRDAACAGHPSPPSFFPTLGEDVRPALELCARCHVRDECRAAADANDERGTWGGSTEKQRRLERQARARRPAA